LASGGPRHRASTVPTPMLDASLGRVPRSEVPQVSSTDDAVRAHGWRWDDRLAHTPHINHTPPTAGDEADLAAWRKQIDPDALGTFDKRLAWSGLTITDAEALIAAQPDTSAPDWWPDLVELRATCRTAAEGNESNADWLAEIDESIPLGVSAEPIPFAHLLWPIAAWAWASLETRIDAACLTLVTAAARDDLRRALVVRLSLLIDRAVTEDFTRNRTAGQSLMLRLGAPDTFDSTSQVAYAAYCRENLGDGLDRLLGEFPVMGRIIAVACSQWRAAATELLERVDRDRPRLCTELGIAEASVLEQVQWGLSDPHRGGRSVAIVVFGVGATQREVVYKPKDITIEQKFHQFVSNVANQSVGGNEPAVRTVLGDDYGYVSRVTHLLCTPDQYSDFYRCAGRLLAILYVLGANDCHYENLIAHGPTLHLIDAETLFEGKNVSIGSAEVITDPDPLEASVLRVGMLPTWILSAANSPSDISGLGIDSRPPERAPVPGWRYVNTDAVVWATRAATGAQPHSLPVDGRSPNPLRHHVDDLIAGFTELYEAAMRPEVSDFIVSAIADFKGVRRRAILRATDAYAVVNRRATSAAALRSARVRGFELDLLSRSSLVSDERPALWDAFLAELHDCENLDIPYFDYPLGSMEIDGGHRVIKGLLEHDGLYQAIRRTQSLSADDLAWQVRLIRGSMAARYGSARESSIEMVRASEHSRDTRARIADANSLRDSLKLTAFPDRTGAPSWLTLLPVSGSDVDRYRFDVVDSGLYAGRVGIAAFLSTSNEHEHVAFAHEVVAPVVRVLTSTDEFERFRFLRESGLGMAGVGGFLRAFDLLARTELAASIDFAALTRTLMNSITAEAVAKDRARDVMSGSAGAINWIARSHQLTPTDETLRTLLLLSGHLLATQQWSTGAWRPSAKSGRPLTGLAHGASGCGLALIEAGVALGDDELVEAGARGLQYEAEVFDTSTASWPDFRVNDDSPGLMAGWCTGSPGIGLARIQALRAIPTHPDADRWSDDIYAAAHATKAAPLTAVDWLCCGNLGRALFLREAAAWSGDAEWIAAAASIEGAVLEGVIERGNFRLSRNIHAADESPPPGLMQGISGIGMYLESIDSGSRDLHDLIV